MPRLGLLALALHPATPELRHDSCKALTTLTWRHFSSACQARFSIEERITCQCEEQHNANINDQDEQQREPEDVDNPAPHPELVTLHWITASSITMNAMRLEPLRT